MDRDHKNYHGRCCHQCEDFHDRQNWIRDRAHAVRNNADHKRDDVRHADQDHNGGRPGPQTPCYHLSAHISPPNKSLNNFGLSLLQPDVLVKHQFSFSQIGFVYHDLP